MPRAAACSCSDTEGYAHVVVWEWLLPGTFGIRRLVHWQQYLRNHNMFCYLGHPARSFSPFFCQPKLRPKESLPLRTTVSCILGGETGGVTAEGVVDGLDLGTYTHRTVQN